jgi:hypothetical protein
MVLFDEGGRTGAARTNVGNLFMSLFDKDRRKRIPDQRKRLEDQDREDERQKRDR